MALKYRDFAHRIDVETVEEELGFAPLEVKDGNAVGYCILPWGLHKNGDTTGKFAIHREQRLYNCWVCGGGNLLSLVMEMKELDEQSATDWLFQFTAPADLTDEDFEDEIQRILYRQKVTKPPMPYFNSNVLTRWEHTDHPWFEERGISENVRDTYRLGYNPSAKRYSSKGDYVGPAIVLPHFWNNRLVGWQHRWCEETPKHIPKYVNTDDFPKSETVFNYEAVYLSRDPIVVVESVSTALYLISLLIPAVATFGASISDEQIRLLRACQQGLILAPDNDSPGAKWISLPDEDLYKGKVPLMEALERYTPVQVAGPVGGPDSGDDLGDVTPDEVRQTLAETWLV
jgi:DNA primase